MRRTVLAASTALAIILLIGGAVVLDRQSLPGGAAPGRSNGSTLEGGSAAGSPSEGEPAHRSAPVDGVRMRNGDESGGTAPPEDETASAADGAGNVAAGDGRDGADSTGPGASLVPLGSGPRAGSAARWVPVREGLPAADEATPDGSSLPAMSLYADSAVRVVSPDSSFSADSIARSVASRSWDELRLLVSPDVPRFVLDAVRESLSDQGEVRWIHEIATADDRAYLLGFPASVFLLRLYLEDQIVVDLEIEEASLIGPPGGADTDSDVLSPR